VAEDGATNLVWDEARGFVGIERIDAGRRLQAARASVGLKKCEPGAIERETAYKRAALVEHGLAPTSPLSGRSLEFQLQWQAARVSVDLKIVSWIRLEGERVRARCSRRARSGFNIPTVGQIPAARRSMAIARSAGWLIL
jgi:hypothetical protein